MNREELLALADHWTNRAREYRRRHDEASARLMDAKAEDCRRKAAEVAK